MRAPDLPPVTYVSIDPVAGGVGASQVLPYVVGLARRGVAVRLHSFELDRERIGDVGERLAAVGVRWMPRRFGAAGAAGGVGRIVRAARVMRGAAFVHARSHPAAAAAALARPDRWVFDARSLWTEQRIEQDMLRRGSAQERVMRRLERRAACTADGVVTLTAAAVPALEARTGCPIASKARVVRTCVDTSRFALTPMPPGGRVRLLLSGTLNALYDIPTMVRLAGKIDGAALEWVGPEGSPWETALAAAGVEREELPFAEMPGRVAAAHAGLCVLRPLASSVAAAPTKIGEFLACGRPVVVDAAIGDLPPLLRQAACGVVVDDTSDEGLDRAASALIELIADPETPGRCRRFAETHFDLDAAVDALVELYRTVAVS